MDVGFPHTTSTRSRFALPERVVRLLRHWNRPVHARPVIWFRRASGVIALLYFVRCLWEASLFSAVDGVVPHALSIEIFWFTWQPLFGASVVPWWNTLVFVGAALLSCRVAMGCRAAAFAAYLIGICLYRWNFPVLYLEDALVHQLLFWSALLPSTRGRREVPGAVVRIMGANLALLYFITVVSKWLSPMWLDGSAL